VRALGPVSFFASGGWQDMGRYTKQSPEAKLDVGLDVARTWRRHAVQANLQLQYVNGLYMNNYRRDRIPDVVVLDATARYQYTVPRRRIVLEPYLIVRNLLDRRYAFVEDYPMPGLSVLAGLKVGM
jgi:outer membrane receptor protein involved in Fe transport